MSKKTPIKKTKRRLKRTVRRSLAAVLMITAIGVAAIPVPENYAESGSENREVRDTHTVYSYYELRNAKKNDESDTSIDELKDLFKAIPNNNSMLEQYSSDPSMAVDKSLKIFNNGSEDELTWEYKYYDSGSDVVLCKYNDRYPRGNVDLAPAPNIEYFKISAEYLNKYFDESKRIKGDGSEDVTGDPLYIDDGKVIINSDTLTIKMDVDPFSENISYSYNDYINFANFELDGYADFFRKYAKNEFDLKTESFKQYKEKLEKWKKDKIDFENEHPGEDYPENEPSVPAPLQGTMSSIIGSDMTRRSQFFVEHCITLSQNGSGYELKAVRDTIEDSSGEAKYAYVAYGGTPIKPGVINVNGYMVTKQGNYVSAIGKKAFENVGNVDNITLPTLVHYIADEAFIHCNSLTSLHIENVQLIGNRAFQSCNNLTKVTMGSGVKKIGVESFEGCAKLSSISFSQNTSLIGAGAFANCKNMSVLNLNNIIEPCEIGAAAFYDCSNLTEVNISESPVKSIGDSAFATISGDKLTEFKFPSSIEDEYDSLGNRLFCNRAALKTVIFPKNYGRNKTITIPESMFHGCSQLSCVEFPTDQGKDPTACANLKYTTGGSDTSSELFADVVNSDFYVSGPKTKTNGADAAPRTSTWGAITKAHNEPGYVPYRYYENGKEFYEICVDNYLECIRENEDGTGTLVSCQLNGTPEETFIIPDKVGDTKVVAIDTDCFNDEELTKSVKKLVINDNIKIIAPSTFENINGKWNNLRDVTIGSAVESIGDKAFYDCSRITDITFKTPINGDYKQIHKFPDNALKTNGSKLTIHGDINTDYSPFKYAMNPNTYVKNAEDGIRVCYQSRWDSPESKHMTVMYGETGYESEDGKNSYVTLLDYPIYDELISSSGMGVELQQHCKDREAQFYEKYSNEEYDQKRIDFAKKWESEGYDAKDDNEESLFGPWINQEFCDNWSAWKNGNPNGTGNTAKLEKNYLLDWLFEPLVVQAIDDPLPYFGKTPFNFITNYQNYNGDESKIKADYMGWNDFEKQIISSVEDIVIPAGVESIDALGFYKNNVKNYNEYIGKSEYTIKDNYEFTEGASTRNVDVVPGLFSGFIKDYAEGSSDYINYENSGTTHGNDRIKSVVMTSVKYLPDYAFDSCARLESVTLGDAMEEVGALPFRDCENLLNLTGNSNYPSENGILYEKQTGENENYAIVECLLARGRSNPISDKTITKLSDPRTEFVSAIDESAFKDCNNLSVIDLSAATTLKTIPEGCFEDCKNLVSVILPASVNDIQDNAFAGVSSESTQDPRCTVEIPGVEVSISDDAFGTGTLAKNRIKIKTFSDTAAYRYATYYAKEGMEVETYPESENMYSVVFLDYDGTQIGNTQYITNNFAVEPDTTELKKADHRPGYEFNGWIGTHNQQLNQRITQSCIFLAQYKPDGSTVDGKYYVKFMDGIDGSNYSTGEAEKLGNEWVYYVTPQSSFKNAGYTVPTEKSHQGYEFLGWYANGSTWSDTASVTASTTVFALYKPSTTSGSSTTTSNGTTTLSNGTTTTSGKTTSTSSSSSNTSSSTSSSSSNTSSSGNSSNTSGSNSTAGTYTVTVENGSGSGTYAAGSTVIIAANTPAEGMVFQKWTTESNGVTLASVSMSATTFVMPANNVTVTANYVAGNGATAATTGTGNGGSTTGNNGNTVVDITKPGISNKDLATANVNGSTDNFVIKISETDEATRAVAAALTNKYGSLDNILYYAMDITLYDSTGTTKITDTSGLSIDITIPIPDALVAYGGNNMAGAVINGDQLEELNESFTTINGVPCVRFTATHFSPYTIYVDTGNLTEGMLDVTPKTGDPIHPKWFLSIGLACLSIILFLKKDKKVKVKTA